MGKDTGYSPNRIGLRNLERKIKENAINYTAQVLYRECPPNCVKIKLNKKGGGHNGKEV